MVCFLFLIFSTALLVAEEPSVQSYFVERKGKWLLVAPPSALEYCAFLNTHVIEDWTVYFYSYYFDSSFMTEEISGSSADSCIIRKLRAGQKRNYLFPTFPVKKKWVYSVISGRENYLILSLKTENSFATWNEWRKHPMAKEIRDYINDKIAEAISKQAIYGDQASRIRDSYPGSLEFFNQFDQVASALQGNRSAEITNYLFDEKTKQKLVYFDHAVAAEGEEEPSDFLGFPKEMQVAAHAYTEGAYYRPEEFPQQRPWSLSPILSTDFPSADLAPEAEASY